ncbi:FMN-binding negative transcriptional regulator [Frankia sp. R82]|uniref:FMN-binding negative transcriptional regulator n=1 Tax=Frankia sp. R82 TaxID=2950553 RepID=UPI002043A9FD|nr:FMN-binding negative transcriptional regulator [Frankia sp. R82]MCM3884432.1 FMN-binding negative transcriptional regulator [Frankia sp. R82]
MYVPRPFELTELDQVVGMVEQIGAVDLVTFDGEGLVATLVPVIWDRTPVQADPTVAHSSDDDPDDAAPERPWAPHGRLLGHIARANGQWRGADPTVAALAILRGPQTYVSPSWYATKAEHGRVVPTWNHMSVHFTGPVVFHHEPAWLREVVARLTDHHERHREQPWSVDDAPEDFVTGQLRAIVGVEIAVRSIVAQAKLSQNRSPADRASVLAGLRDAGEATSPTAAAVADLMRRFGPAGTTG